MQMQTGIKLNRFERIKAEKNALTMIEQIDQLSQMDFSQIPNDDLDRLKILGVVCQHNAPGHFSLRVRIPAGKITSVQARRLGHIAKQFGSEFVDITARGQVQLRGLAFKSLPIILKMLDDCKLATLQTLADSVRNIRSCPLAGISDHEAFDATPIITQLEKRILGNKQLVNLPRKINIAITGCTCQCCDIHTQDLSLVPAKKMIQGIETLGFNLLAGGKISAGNCHFAQPLDIFVTPEKAVEVIYHVIEIYRDHGPRKTRTQTRLVYLLNAWGVKKFRQAIQNKTFANTPTVLETAGESLQTNQACTTLGKLDQKQAGRCTLGLSVPVGRITATQLMQLANIAQEDGESELRFTADQNILIPHLSRDHIDDVLNRPVIKDGLSITPHAAIHGTQSCTGIDYCKFAIIETKQRALALAKELQRRVPNAKPLRIHWSGCRAGCGQHTLADIGLLGRKVTIDGQTVEAVDIFIGGSPGPNAAPGFRLMQAVPCDQLADVLEGIVRYGDLARFRQIIYETLKNAKL